MLHCCFSESEFILKISISRIKNLADAVAQLLGEVYRSKVLAKLKRKIIDASIKIGT
jgi:hypothetical protein